MRLAYAPYTLKFNFPAGTSRGVLTEKTTYFIKIWNEEYPELFGIGEAPLFRGLSAEDNDRYEYKLMELLANVALGRPTDLSLHSSIQFGFEQAILDFSGGCKGIYYPSPFTQGESEITINGLVWMGNYDEMFRRLESKITEGFACIKIKIGAIDWWSEIDLIRWIRKRYSAESLTVRVDANGAFSMEEVFPRLAELSKYNIHSIEQPIRPGFPELMAFVCKKSPVPVALDEELIGVNPFTSGESLLSEINPQYIILKPALCGGFSGAEKWISLAKHKSIGWWVTSALESNVGLSALAQWTATLHTFGAQGLGTGALFTNNAPSALRLRGDKLSFDTDYVRDNKFFTALPWRE